MISDSRESILLYSERLSNGTSSVMTLHTADFHSYAYMIDNGSWWVYQFPNPEKLRIPQQREHLGIQEMWYLIAFCIVTQYRKLYQLYLGCCCRNVRTGLAV